MFFCFECCVLSGRCLCDGLFTRTEESYRVCVYLSVIMNLGNEALARYALLRHGEKI